MQRLPGAIAIFIGLTAPASAAAISTAPAETGGMILIGAGLILGASFARVRTGRR